MPPPARLSGRDELLAGEARLPLGRRAHVPRDAVEEFAEGHLAVQRPVNREVLCQQAVCRLQVREGPPVESRADDNVCLPAVVPEQGLPAGEQERGDGAAVAAGETT